MPKKASKTEQAMNAVPLRTRSENAVRSRTVGVKVNDDEHALMNRVARERGFRSVSDLLRAAFNHFAGLQ